MKKYLGVKIVEAEFQKVPETFGFIGEHSEEREAYKVVYEDGYVSWSPKDVFEKAYKEVGVVADEKEERAILVNPSTGNWHVVGSVATIEVKSFIERLIDEKSEVDVRTAKLEVFIMKEDFKKIDVTQQALLNIQLKAMQTYSQCLQERLVLLQK